MVEKPKNDDDRSALEEEVKKLKSSIIAREGIGEDCTYEKKQLADTLKALGQSSPKKEAKKGRGNGKDSSKNTGETEKPTTSNEDSDIRKKSSWF